MPAPEPRCPACGGRLVLRMDPSAPPDGDAEVLLADPPFGLACDAEGCPRGDPATGP